MYLAGKSTCLTVFLLSYSYFYCIVFLGITQTLWLSSEAAMTKKNIYIKEICGKDGRNSYCRKN